MQDEAFKLAEDPHGCWDSCSKPGSNCLACTNENYFTCKQSGVCIHEDLRCDGHPQCKHGEDEDVETCFESWVRRKIVSPAASLRCSSKRYPGNLTVSVACDGVVECSDGADETSCTKPANSIYLLLLLLSILFIYLGLKLFRKYKHKKNSYIIKRNRFFLMAVITKTWEKILEEFESNRCKPEVVAEVNTYLFHIIYSRKTEESKRILKKLFELEAKIQGNDESKIYHSLHQYIDPALVVPIVESKIPGFTDKIISCFETLFCSKWITWMQDRIIATEWMSELISTLFTMAKIFASFVDLFKDTFLAITLITILGGPLEVFTYPTQFTSVVVMVQMASIILPLIASSLHLAINNPNLILDLRGVRRSVVFVIHLGCSFLIPVLLIHRYEASKEKIRKLAKRNGRDIRVPVWVQKCRIIKSQIVEFFKIELGRWLMGV